MGCFYPAQFRFLPLIIWSAYLSATIDVSPDLFLALGNSLICALHSHSLPPLPPSPSCAPLTSDGLFFLKFWLKACSSLLIGWYHCLNIRDGGDPFTIIFILLSKASKNLILVLVLTYRYRDQCFYLHSLWRYVSFYFVIKSFASPIKATFSKLKCNSKSLVQIRNKVTSPFTTTLALHVPGLVAAFRLSGAPIAVLLCLLQFCGSATFWCRSGPESGSPFWRGSFLSCTHVEKYGGKKLLLFTVMQFYKAL